METILMKPIKQLSLFAGLCVGISASAGSLELVRDSKPNATIVIGEKPALSARLAALELQYHIQELTGAVLPIKDDVAAVTGNRMLVGESKGTRDLGIRSADFAATEYMIKFLPDTLVLIGLDWVKGMADPARDPQGFDGRRTVDYNKAVGRNAREKLNVVIPSCREEQGTCYAVYDFLERYVGVRWYGPTRLNIVFPKKNGSLVVKGEGLRRFPSIKHRQLATRPWPVENRILWNEGNDDEYAIFQKRVRDGGLRWMANHSALDGDWLKDKKTGDALGYSDRRLVDKLVEAARNFFDGKGLPEFAKKPNCSALAMGDYFAIVPNDSNLVRVTAEDRKLYDMGSRDERGKGCFGTAKDSYYFFQLLNQVAKELKKTHPDKKIATLAYAGYSYMPKGLELESNITVSPCLLACGYEKGPLANDRQFYGEWVDWSRKVGASLFCWGYFHAPFERGMLGGFNVFPLFVGDRISQDVRQYVKDKIEGVYLCGAPLQPDYQVYMRTAWDAGVNADCNLILDEFFSGYFGAAGQPMRQFYDRIMEINREEGVIGTSLEISWSVLGTDKRMQELGSCMAKALDLAATREEKARVELWKAAFWKRMVEGKEMHRKWLEKESARRKGVDEWEKAVNAREEIVIHDKVEHEGLAKDFIPYVRVMAHSAECSPYSLVDGRCMVESKAGLLGTRDAGLDMAKCSGCWHGFGADGVWVKFDLMQPYLLDEIRIWNHPGDRGMKNVRVEYSATGRRGDWVLLEALALKKANSASPSNIVMAGGKRMRFVRIVSEREDGGEISQASEANGKKRVVGLAQIRFYGSKAGE
ncbi:MAG: DUF4838 domain-containing protein [Verrucomicrobiae bacterium]|nr:DUF4838 domain-containing protein [Verrucomicrobiae bacterium]